MDAEWVKVLHITDRNTVIEAVTDDLVFDFLPPLETFLDKDLWRERESLTTQLVQLLLIITEATTQTS